MLDKIAPGDATRIEKVIVSVFVAGVVVFLAGATIIGVMNNDRPPTQATLTSTELTAYQREGYLSDTHPDCHLRALDMAEPVIVNFARAMLTNCDTVTITYRSGARSFFGVRDGYVVRVSAEATGS